MGQGTADLYPEPQIYTHPEPHAPGGVLQGPRLPPVPIGAAQIGLGPTRHDDPCPNSSGEDDPEIGSLRLAKQAASAAGSIFKS